MTATEKAKMRNVLRRAFKTFYQCFASTFAGTGALTLFTTDNCLNWSTWASFFTALISCLIVALVAAAISFVQNSIKEIEENINLYIDEDEPAVTNDGNQDDLENYICEEEEE